MKKVGTCPECNVEFAFNTPYEVGRCPVCSHHIELEAKKEKEEKEQNKQTY